MVMEAATLTSPQRKYSVVPVQKSLSLPSYARAGGGGIDHRLIFEALEQKEKGRRKSKLFTREKKNTRHNIFCLPIPSSRHDKCRETSFSSDTSCSSLEYQKPKKADPKQAKTTTNPNEASTRTIHLEVIKKETPARSAHSEVTSSDVRSSEVRSSEVGTVEVRRSPIDSIARLNVGSSDSMERSSRSSTDSFSRKERLVAIKARVEAEREKYGESSSEEESRSTMTRYNSDGSIHRSVREVKSKSSRSERRLRRRSQGEWTNQPTFGCSKANRKKNLNLSLLNTEENGIRLSLERPSRVNNDIDHLDIKTDFCPSPNFPDLMKKNYFSDFPSRENSARFVQARIRLIEDEERKRRSGSDFREKIRTPPRQSPQSLENTSPASTERRFQFDKQNSSASSIFEKNASGMDLVGRGSPLPRTTQAPTPPPRSPKSMTFMNKAFIQHQNASLRNKQKSLDEKKCSGPSVSSISYTEILEQFNTKSDTPCNEIKHSAESLNNSTDKQKFREMVSNRRKTCGNFDFIDKNILDDLCSIKSPVDSSNSIVAANKKFSSVMQIRGQEGKGYFSGSETPCAPSEEDIRGKLWKSKWQENEQRRECMFNSLENKKPNPPSWSRLRSPSKPEACLCRLFPDEKFMCICKSDLKEKNASGDVPFIKQEIFNPLNEKNVCILPIRNTPDRLSKSEVNIASKEQDKSSLTRLNKNQASLACKNAAMETNDVKNGYNDKMSASANLESAMEELESVYRSLKFSSDNLSDRNSVSNASLSDDGSKTLEPKDNDCSMKYGSDFKRRSSVCETNWKSDTHKISINIGEPDKSAFKNFSALSSPGYPTPNSISKTTDTNQLSIDELFNNMTLQLDDLEHNLLKNPTVQHSQKPTYEPNRLDNNRCNNNNLSQISIRKQFYDNLCKSNQNQSKTHAPIMIANDSRGDSNVCIDKKKHKAVRSLSQNISYLMTSPDSTRDKNCASNNIGEINGHTSHPTLLDQPCNERARFDPSKAGATFKQSNLFSKTDGNSVQCPRRDEIRQIRVSMDSDFCPSKPAASDSFHQSRQYPRLSSALSSPSKSEGNPVQEVTPGSIPNDGVDVDGLEKLLNSLLGEGSERQQSSLLGSPTTPPASSGKFEDVKSNRALFPLKMDVYVASKQNKVPSSDCPLKNIKPPEENAQKVNNFSQNNNASVGQSFIPVYTKKTDMCHNFPRNTKDEKTPCKRADSPEPTKSLNFGHSPPLKPKVLADPSEKTAPVKTWSMHMRRRSVGFEDMTSVASRYGYNLTNDQRVKTRNRNYNLETGSVNFSRNNTNSESDKGLAMKLKTESENGSVSKVNQNTQLSENENNHVPRASKPSQYLKDKSSKRKSSLNRIDFVDYPTCAGNTQHEKVSHHRNSSSDEEGDSKSQHAKHESLSTNSKRKYSLGSSSPSLPKAADRKINEVPQVNSTVGKGMSNPLPRSLQKSQTKLRQHRRTHSASHLHKLSHSAGELESLTDPSETTSTIHKICLSAQEFDTHETPQRHSKTSEVSLLKRRSQVYQPPRSHSHAPPPWRRNTENSSHCPPLSNSNCLDHPQASLVKSEAGDCPSMEKEPIPCDTKAGEPVLGILELNGTLDIKHMDSRSEEDSEVAQSTAKIFNLDISGDNEIYISAEENADLSGSEAERFRGSILRKKSFEEKKELHGILKAPSEDNPSRTPPSILKHRDSSEEKEMWFQGGDLHSILKKSTSEEESCNSGSDVIRPILKVSTDEDSPGGYSSFSPRPRPILKKRTSFSEECFYASYPNGELKPILKKKIALLTSEEQPRPILKSRRKSEDTKSFSEFVASRPRAYSADMGVKPSNHEARLEDPELGNDDPGRCEDHRL